VRDWLLQKSQSFYLASIKQKEEKCPARSHTACSRSLGATQLKEFNSAAEEPSCRVMIRKGIFELAQLHMCK